MIILNRTKKVLRNAGGLFLLMLLFSCSSKQEGASVRSQQAPETEQPSTREYEKGKVINAVQVHSHPSESFALYIPSTYIKEKKYPVIFFFDSHGSGAFPLNKYKDLAEKFEVILAGSNNSRNGLPYESILPFAQHMMSQVKNDLSIDEKSIFTSGFSGGARVAANIAFTETSVKGVIGCSAGFDPRNDSLPIVFAGITADEDMNYLEMKMLERVLDKNKGEHILLTGKGKHEWPDTMLMKDAFRFMIFRTQLKGTRKEWVDEFFKENLPYKAVKITMYQNTVKLHRFLEGISNSGPQLKDIEEMEKDAEIVQWKSRQIKEEEKEVGMQEFYSDALLKKDISWWKAEVKKLNGEGPVMNKRVLNYLSLQTYMLCNRALKEDNRAAIEHFVTVYSLVDPSNPEWAYLSAVYYTMTGNKDQALEHLERSIELGFRDTKRAETEAAFNSIRSDSRYAAAIAKMQQ